VTRLIPPELQDLSTWPTVDPSALDGQRRKVLLGRIEAVRLYLARYPLNKIIFTTGVSRTQFYHLLRRCVEPHPDGRIRGFRALIPYARATPYERTKPVAPTTRTRHSGSSGAMVKLLKQYDSLTALLRRRLSEHAVFIGERGQVCGLHDVHDEFLDACRTLGLDARDYPLNQERQGIRSLSRAIRELAMQSFASGARAAGAQHISPPWADERYAREPGASRPLEIVEFDGHKLDVRLHVRYQDAAGVIEDIDVNRVWLLVILDVYSRAILGWNMVLSAEYNRNDVMRTVQQALSPQRKRQKLTIPGLSYSTAGGFVGEVIPALESGCWERLRLDNAKANLAADTLSLLCTVVGCVAEAGPVASPTERPFVERFFGTMTRTLSHRLPGTTGSHPDDIRRRLTNPKGKESLSVSFDELLELVEVTIANYNGTPHEGIGARSPLEFLTRAMGFHGDCVRVLSEPFRRQLWTLQPSRLCTVAGSLKSGKRPYINLHGVRYSSRLLQQATDLIGKELRVFIDPQDLRIVHAYLPNGAEFGPLNASRPWHRTQHSLRLRQEIMRLRRQRKLHFTEADDPVRIFLDSKRKQATKQRGRVAHRTAEAARSLGAAPCPATAPATDPVSDLSLDPPILPIVKPRPLLRIGKGQVMKKGDL
jgi:putative transposase